MEPAEPVKPVIPTPIRKGRSGSGMEWTHERLLAQLGEWRRYLQEQDRSPGTVEKYVEAVNRFLVWYEQEEGAPLQLEAFTPIALIGYRNYLQHEQQKSVSTINLRISALRAWCGWLVDGGYLASDPSARVRLVRTASMSKDGGRSSKREGLTSSQVNALLRQAQSSGEPERNYAIVQVLLQTGIRLSECSGLRPGDITFGERSGMLLVRAGKGNKARSVPLNASAREALAIYVAPRLGLGDREGEKASLELPLKALLKMVTARWPKPGTPQALEPLWLSRKGGALTSSAIGQMMAELVRAAGKLVPQETTVHSLRHTFARSYLSAYPGDVVGLATLLGHSSLDTTRLYSQPAASQLAARVERLPLNAYSG
jgi:site-specific recombinase XerD